MLSWGGIFITLAALILIWGLLAHTDHKSKKKTHLPHDCEGQPIVTSMSGGQGGHAHYHVRCPECDEFWSGYWYEVPRAKFVSTEEIYDGL